MNPPPRVETPGAPVAETASKETGAQLLPSRIAEVQKISGAPPQFPAEPRLPGRAHVVSAKICVSSTGRVDAVSILADDEPVLANNVVKAVKEWRYRPLTAQGGAALPFCYVATFQFKAS